MLKEYTQDQLLANEVEQVYRQFMHMPNEHCFNVATLWVMHTHLRDMTGEFLPYITPRLYFGSKIAGCGKSLALKITTRLSHNGEMVLEPTAASVTTLLNQDRATLGFDEIDTFFGRTGRGRDSMRAILNGGYESGAFVTRQRSDVADRQYIHGPIVLAGKNATVFLTHENFETLRTRSIPIILDQKPADTYVDRYNPERHNPRLRGLMERTKDWGLSNGRAITSISVDGVMPKEIANRAEEIWTVLFQIAQHLGDEWPKRIEKAARAFVLGEWDESDVPCISPAQELLTCVQVTFADEDEFLPTAEILFRLANLPQRASLMDEWQTKRSAEMGLSNALAVFGVKHVRRQVDGEQEWGYDRGDVGCPDAPSPVLAV